LGDLPPGVVLAVAMTVGAEKDKGGEKASELSRKHWI